MSNRLRNRGTIMVGLLGLLVMAGAIGVGAWSQQISCRVEGFVVDPQGRGVPNAEVWLNLEGREPIPNASNQLGYFLFRPVDVASETVRGSIYARLGGGTPQMVGRVDFRRCRLERNVFVNANPDPAYTPGLPVPTPGPGIPPPYPAPATPPPPALVDAVIMVDPGPLTQGGVTPGSTVTLPLCVARREGSQQEIQIDQVAYVGAFNPSEIQVSPPEKDTTRFDIFRESTSDNRVGTVPYSGRVTYSAWSNQPVDLPVLPNCVRIASITLTASRSLTPGSKTVLVSMDGTKMRLASSSEGLVTRGATYLDILPMPHVYLPIIMRNNAGQQAD